MALQSIHSATANTADLILMLAVCLDSFAAKYFLETSLDCRITSARCKKLSPAPYIIGNMGDCSCQRQLGRLGDYSHQWCAAWRSTTVAVGSKRVNSRCLYYDDDDCYYYYYKKCITSLCRQQLADWLILSHIDYCFSH